MGKTRRYHPVSLHVIRGAAEYCGWKFSYITQIDCEPERQRARYTAQIELIPKKMFGRSTIEVQNELQECFLDDIRVHWLRTTKSGKYLVDLEVNLSKEVSQ